MNTDIQICIYLPNFQIGSSFILSYKSQKLCTNSVSLFKLKHMLGLLKCSISTHSISNRSFCLALCKPFDLARGCVDKQAQAYSTYSYARIESHIFENAFMGLRKPRKNHKKLCLYQIQNCEPFIVSTRESPLLTMEPFK